MYKFEKLRVFQDSLDLLEEVYKVASTLPQEEKSSFSQQLKKSCMLISLFIVEGVSGSRDSELRLSLKHALKSLNETAGQLKITERLFRANVERALQRCDKIECKLTALIKLLTEEGRMRRLQLKDLSELTNDEQ